EHQDEPDEEGPACDGPGEPRSSPRVHGLSFRSHLSGAAVRPLLCQPRERWCSSTRAVILSFRAGGTTPRHDSPHRESYPPERRGATVTSSSTPPARFSYSRGSR